MERNEFSSPGPARYAGAMTLLFLTAAALLCLLIGKGALVSVEGEAAEGARLFLRGEMEPSAGPRLLGRALVLRESLRFFGVSEAAVRIPSVLAALLMLAGSVVLAAQRIGKRGALLTGWMLLGSYGFLYWGRSAAGAIFPAACVVWAAVLGQWREKPFSFLRCFAAGVILFGSLVFCNNLAFCFILLFWLPELFSRKVWRGNGKWTGALGFLCALLFVALGTFLLLHWQFQGRALEFFQLLIREGRYPIAKWVRRQSGFSPLSLLNLPRLLLPWTFFTCVAVFEIFRHRKRIDPAIFRMALSLILMFLLAGIWPMRRWGALLPLLPFALILTGAGLDAALGFRLLPFLTDKGMRILLMVTASLIAVFPVSWPLWEMLLQQNPPAYLMLILPALGLLALGLLNGEYLPGNRKLLHKIIFSRFSGTVLAGVVVMASLLCVLQPGMTPFRTGKRFWYAVREKMEEENVKALLFFRTPPRSASLFYLNLPRSFPVVRNTENLEEELRRVSGNSVLVIARNREENRRLIVESAEKTGWNAPQDCDLFEDPPLNIFQQRNPENFHAAELFGAWFLHRTK